MKKTNLDVMYSSKTDMWATPQDFFDKLNNVFNFTLDPCASEGNAKCDTYFTEEDDGLLQKWGGHTVFCNPPYGREIGKWVKKCCEESRKHNITVVMLIPSRTDTRYQHDYVFKYATTACFIKGRLKFGEATNSAPFPSMVAVFGKLENHEKEILDTYGKTVMLNNKIGSRMALW